MADAAMLTRRRFLLVCWLVVEAAVGLRLPVAPARAPSSRAGQPVAAEPPAAGAALTKKNERRRIMSKNNYVRGGSPFDRAIHTETKDKMSATFAGALHRMCA